PMALQCNRLGASRQAPVLVLEPLQHVALGHEDRGDLREPWVWNKGQESCSPVPKRRQKRRAELNFCRPFGARIVGLERSVDPRAHALGSGLPPPPGAQAPVPDRLSVIKRRMAGDSTRLRGSDLIVEHPVQPIGIRTWARGPPDAEAG